MNYDLVQVNNTAIDNNFQSLEKYVNMLKNLLQIFQLKKSAKENWVTSLGQDKWK